MLKICQIIHFDKKIRPSLSTSIYGIKSDRDKPIFVERGPISFENVKKRVINAEFPYHDKLLEFSPPPQGRPQTDACPFIEAQSSSIEFDKIYTCFSSRTVESVDSLCCSFLTILACVSSKLVAYLCRAILLLAAPV